MMRELKAWNRFVSRITIIRIYIRKYVLCFLFIILSLVFINTCKDHANSSGASLRQYIFLQIGVYSMQKYPLQAWQYEIEWSPAWMHQVLLCLPSNCPGFIKCFVISDCWLDGSYEQRTLIGWADLNLFIDHAVKTKTNKMDHDFVGLFHNIFNFTIFFHGNAAVWELGIHSLR